MKLGIEDGKKRINLKLKYKVDYNRQKDDIIFVIIYIFIKNRFE